MSTVVHADWSRYEPNSDYAMHRDFGNTPSFNQIHGSTTPQNMAASGPIPYAIPPLQRIVPALAPNSQAGRYAYSDMMPYQPMPQGHFQNRVGPMPAPLTISMPTPPPRSHPISAPGFGSQVYPNSTTRPSPEDRSMLQASTHFLQDQSPGPANRDHRHHHHRSRRPRSASRPRAIHREDVDASGSKSLSAREGNRGRSEIDRIPLPPDYVTASRAHEESSSRTRRRDRDRSAPPPDHSQAFPVYGVSHSNSRDAQATVPPYLQAPYGSSHFTSNHATPVHHHRHHHNGHGHNRKHRASSQPPQQQQQPRHHGQSYAAPPSSRPTYARQRSYSVDASDPRIARPHQTGTFTTSGDYNTGHGTRYGNTNLPQPYPGAHAPSQSSNYRIIVQPPSTTRSNGQSTARPPVGVPISDGRGGWVTVPRDGQNVHPSPRAHNSAYSSTDSRGREKSPGFWASLFGRKRRSNSATPGTVHFKTHRNHDYEAQSHLGHGIHRPHNIRRRSSR
ncbi:hypothetical protein HYPSUDRAFT_858416 [Hypholoma sublateritium FD-334 SS-4]|uniref:Uncharacterized protein n=1 Tax=Hypholoma sublateritium (strain FD-334 SS-4) TaxID=945553 RepID=A0A0D2NL08_HYPSF|nr:hypothetical protein HYPSUDRAFT_858416 [Hypholoma sublateritium FD-334 SS-4]